MCERGSTKFSLSCIVNSVQFYPIRTLYPSKIIVSNKLLGLLGFRVRVGVWDLGQGLLYMHEMTIPVTIGIIKRSNQ